MKKYLLFFFFYCIGLNAQIINFPDANFKAKLLQASTSNQIAKNGSGISIVIDSNGNNEIERSEALLVYQLNVSNAAISNLNGLEEFLNLRILDVQFNLFSTLDISTNHYIDEIDFSNNPNLIYANLKNSVIGYVFGPPMPGVPLQYIYSIRFSNCNSLQYVCIENNEPAIVQFNDLAIMNYGYTNCHINSYCSFVPGGTFYSIQGNNKFDSNNNGCDVSDIVYPNLEFNITDGSNVGSLISNFTGNFNIPVQSGTYTITPVFENPNYFTVAPPNLVVNFPTQSSPFAQNFCVTPNGVHSDVEISILPIDNARPGFDASYKIAFKNKGNQVENGSVNLTFEDAKMDFVSSNPVFNSQATNHLTWNYSNLQPFETRMIDLIFNINSPTESPAVNGGDVLNYTSSITSVATDDLPSDNTFTLNQTVVNSYDPNDKTCLEGATIPPSKVGDYVHYMIRFENNGTANAQNIVVKDMIDLTKFDSNSLVPIKGSHSFVTNITAGNKVEFIFENINLPFDDANNNGYVAFKIKTKPTLVLGNTFSNTASIYFDYNFPIVTNTATTTIAALSRQDFEFSNYFSVYPNPVSNVLNITAKETIEINSINIYNTLGQLVLVIPNAENIKVVDVSSLTSGNYFIKINSDQGTSNTKFIKQ
ncbi:T9SS type A sorting domain-containing protein [Flavobacterium amnicola]|uniref:T9SS type A sorting domain-containing protein n=1 Tax=Flavobacterium amnicola TaxID=2506422 RepID=A0A4Q1K3E3_9FLAO|nr:T9SS type A sorting domain-containing protein [Flavobacterium amnicola]RXR17268.1 T9SS type A sorting domain-containing protein [Flavobacterium amnicola]